MGIIIYIKKYINVKTKGTTFAWKLTLVKYLCYSIF